MLFAVEGGGFFSSSASGEERPMRVSPWNHYQLVGQGVDPDVQLASKRSHVSRKCAFFICFRRASARLDGPSPPQVGPAQHPTDMGSASDMDEVCVGAGGGDENGGKVHLKSNLRRSPASAAVRVHRDATHASGTHDEEQKDGAGRMVRRRVHWRDACGSDLAEVREFDVSEEEPSDEELEPEGIRACECVIQ
ncbi:unnamed protein product [Spirodela intermedia]|uniref:Uncharacterized protein n=1 Tax=Spirodela intermedia TaxID=51605 RepID=A0A7I8J865_SPIIN|nr:unnamed protein product [Spirodela intermedia]CAA6666251.1 unnamed protein product [Spirodela intermedia]